MLSETEQQDLVWASIGLMQTVTDIYGAEQGMELWNTIADTIDPDLKSAVFVAMLTGSHDCNRITVRNPLMGPVNDKVGLIRCIRTYDCRRPGLKEAKDIADSLADAGRAVLEVEPAIKPTFRVELRKFGLVV